MYDTESHDQIPDTNESAQHIFSVSELNQYAREILENSFPMIWLEAEVSNLVQPSSGHIYLTLKDKNAQVRGAMFKGRNQRLTFKPKNGDQVLVKGRLSLYAPRGDYQLIIDAMQEAGLGALQRAFEVLKRKLAAEGLFADELKKPLPAHPNAIGVVTSPTGAAIQDIISVLKRRFPLTPIIIYPCAVQGEEAPAQLVSAIQTANRRRECEVLIVGRGGGSLEDLWAFNNESLARAIRASNIPIVSAVGHQIDFTIADFVADVRAPTPSAAAELLSQDQAELRARFAGFEQLLLDKLSVVLQSRQQQLVWLEKQLKHPGKKLQEQQQRLDMLETRLTQSLSFRLDSSRSQHKHLAHRLLLQAPRKNITQQQTAIKSLEQRLAKSVFQSLKAHQQQLGFSAQQLNAVSPLATLSRGYAIVKDDNHKIVRGIADVKAGDRINAQLGNGSIDCEIIARHESQL